jgi:hypothetical protein
MLTHALKTFADAEPDTRHAFLRALMRQLDQSERELVKQSLAQKAAA